MRKILFLLFIALLTIPSLAAGLTAREDLERTRLISYILHKQLSDSHFSHKQINDELSEDAFSLFLRQVDPQKRFLLRSDTESLRSRFEKQIDNELTSGFFRLPAATKEIFNRRLAIVKSTIIPDIFSMPFDYKKEEMIETDPKKRQWLDGDWQIRQRWRKQIKYQIMSRFLSLQDEEKEKEASEKKLSEQELWQTAHDKVKKSIEKMLERMEKEDPKKTQERYLTAITHAFDPHTVYMPPTEKEDFDIHMRGSLEGIGALLREEDGFVKVVSVLPGGAAIRQGQLQAKDTILKVGEKGAEPVEITDLGLRKAVSLIRGKKGTEVRLTIQKPNGIQFVIPIVRDVVQIEETFVKSTTLTGDNPDEHWGYIKIPSFYRDFSNNSGQGRNATDDTRKEIKKLLKEKISGLIIDLRNNGGGALMDAVSTTGLFIETGPVVQVKDSAHRIKILSDYDPSLLYTGPLVVLVNQFSASASEIFAAAIQDYHRGIVVGSEHTHGKGTVQAIVDLDRTVPYKKMEKFKPLGALKVTIQKFYRINGDSTQYRGVLSDIVLPDRLSHLKTGEKYLDFSLPWDEVDAVSYKEKKEISVKSLQKLSAKRVNGDEKFIEIRQQQAVAKERSEQTIFSLKMADVRLRHKEEKQLLDAMDNGHSNSKEMEKTTDPSEKFHLWEESVRDDPYAKEAVQILEDMRG